MPQSQDLPDTQTLSARIEQNLFPRRRLYRSSLQVEAFSAPSLELGGDLFDIIPMDRENLLALLVGDVSGKGIPAAIFMSMLKGMLWTLIRYYQSPREILHRANRLLLENSQAKKFVTLFLVVFDLSRGEMKYSVAGHNPGFILSRDGHLQRLKAKGLPLGVRENVRYEEKVTSLEEQDLLVLYTDGITEAQSPRGEEFGELRLIDFLRRHNTMTLPETISHLDSEIKSFCGASRPQDDIALIISRFLTPASPSDRNFRAFPAHMKQIPAMLDFLTEGARSALGKDRLNDLLISAEELCTNIIKHQELAHELTISLTTTSQKLFVEIAERGSAFDPTVHVEETKSEFTGGGKGLVIIRNLVDSFEYRRDETRGNVVTLGMRC